MRLFISYSTDHEDLAERLSFALRSEGHSTFFDRASLNAGKTFDNRIRTAIEECDLMLFLISEHSVEAGSYARAELAIAQSKWEHPDGHILPIMVAPIPVAQLPPFLRSVSILRPQGDVIPEVVAAVAALSKPEWNLPIEARALLAVEAQQHKADVFAFKFFRASRRDVNVRNLRQGLYLTRRSQRIVVGAPF